MMLTRRRFLTASAAATGLATLPGRLWAMTTLQTPVGEVITLSDGHLMLPESFLYGTEAAAPVDAALAAAGISRADAMAPPCNLTLLRMSDRLVIFDAGAGPTFMPSVGFLPEALAAAGIDPLDVTDVIFTHGHPDHLWGAVDDFDEAVFANARHWMGETELAYWQDPAIADSIGAERQSFAAGALRRLDLLADRMTAFADAGEVVPGIRAIPTPGHTPGHTGFRIGEAAMIVGDAIANAHVAFALPGRPAPSDQDPATAAATRTALIAMLADDALPMVGFHLPSGGIGTVARKDDSYAFVAA